MRIILFLILLCVSGFSLVKAQTVIWQENFSAYSDTNTSANDDLPNPPGPPNADGKTDWVRDISSATNIPPGYFYIQNAATDASFEARDTQGEVTWTSQYVDISSYNRVYLTLDIQHRRTLTNDTLRAYYRLDDGGDVLFGQYIGTGIFVDWNWVSNSFAAYSLSGDSLQIVIKSDVDDELLFGFLQYNAQILFDNVTVTQQRELFSINTGNWNTNGNWSVTSGGGSCGCTPVTTDFVHIENGYTININGSYDISGIHIYNTSTLQWTGNNELRLNGGSVTIDTGGSLDRNGNTGDITLEQSGSVSFVVNGTATISNLEYNNNNITVTISGNSSLNIDADLNIQSTGGFFGAPYTGENLSNSGDIVIAGNIDLNSGFGGSNGEIVFENYGDITLSGIFTNINTTSRFENYNNATWNYGGPTYDADVQLYCDNGSNIFEYSLAGNQDVLTPQDAYSNLTMSGSGTKELQADFIVKEDITLSGTASADAATNTVEVSLEGASQQNLTGTLTFYDLAINNTVSGNAVSLNDPISVTNSLTLTDGIVGADATNILQMNATATVSGQSDASFINGPMRYNSVSGISITFPVGKAGELHQVDVNVTGTSANYTAEYINSSAGALGYTYPATLDAVSGVGYWTITNGSVTVTTADVTLYYNANDFVSDAANLRVAKDDGSGNWLDLGGTGSAIPSGFINSTTNFTDFSEFSLANALGGGNGLPVEWLSFTGNQDGQLILLQWKTASETNNDYFTVERSEDGISFEDIGTIEGSGNTVDVREYEFFDESPLEEKNYYRIKQTDFDGQFDYSRLILVKFNGPYNDFLVISPNPVTSDIVRIRIPKSFSDSEMLLQIIDAKGRIIRSEDIQISQYSLSLTIDRNLMPPGIYIIHLYGLQGIVSGRLIIHR